MTEEPVKEVLETYTDQTLDDDYFLGRSNLELDYSQALNDARRAFKSVDYQGPSRVWEEDGQKHAVGPMEIAWRWKIVDNALDGRVPRPGIVEASRDEVHLTYPEPETVPSELGSQTRRSRTRFYKGVQALMERALGRHVNLTGDIRAYAVFEEDDLRVSESAGWGGPPHNIRVTLSDPVDPDACRMRHKPGPWANLRDIEDQPEYRDRLPETYFEVFDEMPPG